MSLRREKEGKVPSVIVILRIRPLYETLTVKPGMVEQRKRIRKPGWKGGTEGVSKDEVGHKVEEEW